MRAPCAAAQERCWETALSALCARGEEARKDQGRRSGSHRKVVYKIVKLANGGTENQGISIEPRINIREVVFLMYRIGIV